MRINMNGFANLQYDRAPQFGRGEFRHHMEGRGGLPYGAGFGGASAGGLTNGGLTNGGLTYGGLNYGGFNYGGLNYGGFNYGGLNYGGVGGLNGNYSPYQSVSAAASQVFTTATQGQPGATYQPLAVSEQTTATGTNYRFLAEQTTTATPPVSQEVLVNVSQPLNGTAALTSITNLNGTTTAAVTTAA